MNLPQVSQVLPLTWSQHDDTFMNAWLTVGLDICRQACGVSRRIFDDCVLEAIQCEPIASFHHDMPNVWPGITVHSCPSSFSTYCVQADYLQNSTGKKSFNQMTELAIMRLNIGNLYLA